MSFGASLDFRSTNCPRSSVFFPQGLLNDSFSCSYTIFVHLPPRVPEACKALAMQGFCRNGVTENEKSAEGRRFNELPLA
jgi:hypothetical protein